jgi:hypothetical protein
MKMLLTLFLLLSATDKLLGQSYDTLHVGLTTTINLIFDAAILKTHLGSGTYVENNEVTQDVLLETTGQRMTLTARTEAFETTNLFVETETAFFNFILAYAEWPTNQLIGIDASRATILKKSAPAPEASNELRGLRRRDSLAILANQAFQKPHVKNPAIGVIDQKMIFFLDGIFVDGAFLFFRVTLRNESNVRFDLGFQGFFIKEDASHSAKRTATIAPSPQTPLYALPEELLVVRPRQEVSKVFVFNKFTLDAKRHFSIEFWEDEKKGQRRVSLSIPDAEILRAKPL